MDREAQGLEHSVRACGADIVLLRPSAAMDGRRRAYMDVFMACLSKTILAPRAA